MSDDLIIGAMLAAIGGGLLATAILEWRYVRRNGWRRHLVKSLVLLIAPLALIGYALIVPASLSSYLIGFVVFVVALAIYLPASVVAVAVGATTKQRPLLWFSGTAIVMYLTIAGIGFASLPG